MKDKLLSCGWMLVQPFWIAYLKITKKNIIGRKVRLSYLSVLEGKNRLGNSTRFIQSSLGYASYLGEECYFYNTQIGKYTCIGPRVKIVAGQHPTKNFASIYPAFYSTKKICNFSYVTSDKFQEFRYCDGTNKSVLIGNDVWIGSDVLIMEGVQIGDGAVIGAGSIVLKDVPPYTIVAGVPAKCIRKRFDSDIIEGLLKTKWWEKSEEWLEKNENLFEDVNLLLERMEAE